MNYTVYMAWESIDERLKKSFKVRIPFPNGSVWLPEAHLTIDDWLTSVAETDEELEELNIPRERFLQNHWPVEKLLELRWDDFSNKRAIWSMSVGRRAYILFSDGFEYQLIAAIEPKSPALYQAVIVKLLQNPDFVPTRPKTIKSFRPDLTPDVDQMDYLHPEGQAQPGSGTEPGKDQLEEAYLSKLLVGCVGSWISLPVLGYWHQDIPDTVNTSGKWEAEPESQENRTSPQDKRAA